MAAGCRVLVVGDDADSALVDFLPAAPLTVGAPFCQASTCRPRVSDTAYNLMSTRVLPNQKNESESTFSVFCLACSTISCQQAIEAVHKRLQPWELRREAEHNNTQFVERGREERHHSQPSIGIAPSDLHQRNCTTGFAPSDLHHMNCAAAPIRSASGPTPAVASRTRQLLAVPSASSASTCTANRPRSRPRTCVGPDPWFCERARWTGAVIVSGCARWTAV